MNFCPQCGEPLAKDIRFCRNCGAAIVSSPVANPGASPLPPSPVPALPKSRGAGRFLLVVAGVLVLFLAVLIAGAILVAHRVAHRVARGVTQHVTQHVTQEVSQAVHSASASRRDTPPSVPPDSILKDRNAGGTDQDVGQILGKLGGLFGGSDGDGDLVEPISDQEIVSPCAPAAYPSQTGAKIPLTVGTVITTSWGVKYGDVEATNTISAVDASSVTSDHRSSGYKDDFGKPQSPTQSTDIVCNGDLASARLFATTEWLHLPKTIHGLVRWRISDEQFREIRATGKTRFSYRDFNSANNKAYPYVISGELRRVESGPATYPLIVNDQKILLPALHLQGVFNIEGKSTIPVRDRLVDAPSEIYIVDDPLDPLVLLWRMTDPKVHGGRFRVEVVRVDFKTMNPPNIVERQLVEQKRAITYGIYFDFDKDIVRPDSEPTLKLIVQAMTVHPDWKLNVEGHTDNIGGDAYNLDLSKRRAAAVRRILIEQYHIAPDRLASEGFGASRPVDTNETLGGRARNRRVELSRE